MTRPSARNQPAANSAGAPPLLQRLLFMFRAPARITRLEDQKRARLVLYLTLGSALVGTIIAILAYRIDPTDITKTPLQATIAATVLCVAFYGVGRWRYPEVSILGFIGMTTGIFILLPFYPELVWELFAFAVVPILLTGMFYSIRTTALFAAAVTLFAFIGVSQLDLALIGERYWTFRILWYWMFFGAVLIVLFLLHLASIEAGRRAELEESNRQLRLSEERLEQRVMERTAELADAQRETEQALVKALEADQVKSQFLASMSHELRTPLNAILNFTRFNVMGLYGELNDRQHDSMNKIINSAQHLLELINDVLDITKIESDMMALFIEENVSVQSVVHDVATAAQALLDGTGKDVRLETQIDPDIPPIVADQRRLRQVLLNLVSNACKFTEAGRIVIRGQRDGDDLRLAVSDTGPGIAPDKLEVIFEPFQQSEAGIKHAGGTGLGLPIARRLVQAHHGDLWVETALGAGSTFYVRLPLRSQALLNQLGGQDDPLPTVNAAGIPSHKPE